MNKPTRVLLIDDESEPARSVQEILQRKHYVVAWERNTRDGLARLADGFDVVVTDLHLRETDDFSQTEGFSVLRHLNQLQPNLPVIMMTGDDQAEMAIEATKLGAYDYILKPFLIEDLSELIDDAVAASRQEAEPPELGGTAPLRDVMIGSSPAIRDVFKNIGLFAPTDLTVLIRGETGTGKELVARAIHRHSGRMGQPFIAVNCAAIPDTLLESELFGYEKGAFTGAVQRRIGRFEQAHDGTLYLDEIGDMNPQTQAKLLRILQDKQIQRLGGVESIPVNVRVVASTHRDLESGIRNRTFREDLFYRLNVASIHLPPLRARLDDIPALVDYFQRRYAVELRVATVSFQADALKWLAGQSWPGNIRELENLICKCLLMARGQPVTKTLLRAICQAAPEQPAISSQPLTTLIASLLDKAMQNKDTKGDVESRLIWEVERELYVQAMTRAEGNQVKAARWLGVSRPTLRKKMELYGLNSPHARRSV